MVLVYSIVSCDPGRMPVSKVLSDCSVISPVYSLTAIHISLMTKMSFKVICEMYNAQYLKTMQFTLSAAVIGK